MLKQIVYGCLLISGFFLSPLTAMDKGAVANFSFQAAEPKAYPAFERPAALKLSKDEQQWSLERSPLPKLFNADDITFDDSMRALEQAGRLQEEDIINKPGIIFMINGDKVHFTHDLFKFLEETYPDKLDRVERLKKVVQEAKMGYGSAKFIDWPIGILGLMSGCYALWNGIRKQAFFQWPSTWIAQAQEAMDLYNKINMHARLLIKKSGTSEAQETLALCKNELNAYLAQKDFNIQLLELSLKSWRSRTLPDIIGPTNAPYTRIILGEFYIEEDRQARFDDETKFSWWSPSTSFELEPLMRYNCSRLNSGGTKYTVEQKKLLLSYYEAVLQAFADHTWRLRKPYVVKGVKIFGASIAIGALWSYYTRSQKAHF